MRLTQALQGGFRKSVWSWPHAYKSFEVSWYMARVQIICHASFDWRSFAGTLRFLKFHILIFTGEKLVWANEPGAKFEAFMPSAEGHLTYLIWVTLLSASDCTTKSIKLSPRWSMARLWEGLPEPHFSHLKSADIQIAPNGEWALLGETWCCEWCYSAHYRLTSR